MRFRFRVKGIVQGIGYRFFTVDLAKKYAFTGWIRNCSNGDVEGEAQGDSKYFELFFDALRDGHPAAVVEKIVQEPLPEKLNEKGFEVTY